VSRREIFFVSHVRWSGEGEWVVLQLCCLGGGFSLCLVFDWHGSSWLAFFLLQSIYCSTPDLFYLREKYSLMLGTCYDKLFLYNVVILVEVVIHAGIIFIFSHCYVWESGSCSLAPLLMLTGIWLCRWWRSKLNLVT